MSELNELEARNNLKEYYSDIFIEIDLKRQIAVFQMCFQDTDTSKITRKSTELTKKYVTEQLAKSFSEEVKRLKFDHSEIELQPVGGVRGTLYHKLIFKRASNVDLLKV